MKKSDKTFQITTATLIALIAAVILQRLLFTAFCMAKQGKVSYYNWDLWQQYIFWLPGRITIISLAFLILALITESLFLILKHKK